MNGFDLGEYFAVRSWGMSLEFMKEKNGKGASLRRIKQLSGARLAIAVGDYENDLSMLRAADISYAPANALDAVKQTVDRVTVHCKDGSIAAIIENLERECGAF